MRPTAVALRNLLGALLITGLASLVAWIFHAELDLANIALVYLVACAWCGLFLGRWASVMATAVAVLEYDFLYVPPRFSIAVYDWHYLLTFAFMVTVSILISELATRLRVQLDLARERADRLRALYEFSRDLSAARFLSQIYCVLIDRVRLEMGVVARMNPCADPGSLIAIPKAGLTQGPTDPDQLGSSIDWTAPELSVPIMVQGQTIAHLVFEDSGRPAFDVPDHRDLLCSFVGLASLAAERTLLAEVAEQHRSEIEQQEMRNLMLSSIAHDLRTPMTAIIGSAQSLGDAGDRIDRATAAQLLDGILDEATHMASLLNKILEMSRLDGGGIEMDRTWNDLEELVRVSLKSHAKLLGDRPVRIDAPAQLPLVECDAILICQVIGNLLENAIRYTPADSPIELQLKVDETRLYAGVLDFGPGVPAGAEEKVFEKFYQVNPEGASGGIGLGLAICRTIIALHGGEIFTERRSGGGAAFWFWVPITPTPAFGRDHSLPVPLHEFE